MVVGRRRMPGSEAREGGANRSSRRRFYSGNRMRRKWGGEVNISLEMGS